MNKQPSRIGLYLVLIIALVAGYFYLNNQVVSQSNYTQKQLEQALEDNKVVDATIQQNREVPTGSVIVDTTDSGQKKVYVTDVNQAIELLNKYDIDVTTQDVPGDNVFQTLLPVILTGALVIFLIMMMNRQMAGGGGVLTAIDAILGVYEEVLNIKNTSTWVTLRLKSLRICRSRPSAKS